LRPEITPEVRPLLFLAETWSSQLIEYVLPLGAKRGSSRRAEEEQFYERAYL